MAEPIVDWEKALVKITVPVHHTAMTEMSEAEIDGETTRSPEELVEMLLYPEHFDLADRMRGTKGHERIEIARTS